jgi:cytochrome c553
MLRYALLLACAPALAQTTTPPPAAAGSGVETKAQTCFACHGQNGNSTNPMYPTLAGQNSRYIYLQLRDFKEGRRKDPQMTPMAEALARDDMLALADFFSKQKQAPSGFKADADKVDATFPLPM